MKCLFFRLFPIYLGVLFSFNGAVANEPALQQSEKSKTSVILPSESGPLTHAALVLGLDKSRSTETISSTIYFGGRQINGDCSIEIGYKNFSLDPDNAPLIINDISLQFTFDYRNSGDQFPFIFENKGPYTTQASVSLPFDSSREGKYQYIKMESRARKGIKDGQVVQYLSSELKQILEVVYRGDGRVVYIKFRQFEPGLWDTNLYLKECGDRPSNIE